MKAHLDRNRQRNSVSHGSASPEPDASMTEVVTYRDDRVQTELKNKGVHKEY